MVARASNLDRLMVVMGLCGLPACGDSGGSGATEGLPPPPPQSATQTTAQTTGGPATTTGSVSACPCPSGEFCVADVDVGREVVEPEPDDFQCRDRCIPSNAANLWCFDAQSCCAPEASCEQGFCRIPDESTSSDGTTAGTTVGSTSRTDGTGSSSSDTTDGTSGTGASSSSSTSSTTTTG